jgi:hypothetical protein
LAKHRGLIARAERLISDAENLKREQISTGIAKLKHLVLTGPLRGTEHGLWWWNRNGLEREDIRSFARGLRGQLDGIEPRARRAIVALAWVAFLARKPVNRPADPRNGKAPAD